MPAAATIPIAQQIVLKLVQKKIPPTDPPANGTDDTNNDNNATVTNIPIYDPVHVLPTQPPTVAGLSMYTPTFAATSNPLRALDEQLRKANDDDDDAARANEERTFKEQEDARMLREHEIETRREQERIDRGAAEARQREEARRKANDEAAERELILKEQFDKTAAGGAADEPADEDLGVDPDEEMLDVDDPANIDKDKTSSASGKGKGDGSSADKSGAATGKKRKIIKTDKLPKPNTRSSAGKPKHPKK